MQTTVSETGRRTRSRAKPKPRAEFTARIGESRFAPAPRNNGSDGMDRLAQGLGWFSVALGATQLLAPRGVSRAIGTGGNATLMRLLGARELASGVAILSGRGVDKALWARVAGDAIDLALLGNAARNPRNDRTRLAAAVFAVAAVTAMDVRASRQSATSANGVDARVAATVGIDRPPDVCYAMWRDFEQLPRFMQYVESIEVVDDRRSRWTVREPTGNRLEWESEILRDEPGKMIEWHTLPGADVPHSGTVTFESAAVGRGSVVRAVLSFQPGNGMLAGAARLFGAVPRTQMETDLRRFKQLLETGEIATTEGQPAGRRSTIGRWLLGKEQPA